MTIRAQPRRRPATAAFRRPASARSPAGLLSPVGLTEAQGGALEAATTPGGGLTMVVELPGASR